ncbi:hypothetical protein HPB52_014280 [Rhipicephalus sanguineus]|uniref:Uncharacterized protein n=1 Tax=Rhipicephalus sanguineus TaxID=34632 RepID=A0A9D4T5P6_RHISA|nr:hypothetical protein HPB52_014280 [Rhipicephalus sanguineus]
MPKSWRRVIREATLASVPTCVACSVIGVALLLLCAAVFTKEYLLPAYAKLRAAAFKASETEVSWSPTYWTRTRPNPLLCSSTACKWTSQSVLQHVSWQINPCDDFYAHVCTRWSTRFEGFVQPPTPLSAAIKLFEDLQQLFRRYTSAKKEALNGAEAGPDDNFFSQMIWVYDECRKAAANGDRLVARELDATLDELGLMSWENRQLPQVVARVDRLLRLGALFTVAVKPSRNFPCNGDKNCFFLAMGPPETPYRRFMLKTPGDSETRYLKLVDGALCAWNASNHACGLTQEAFISVTTEKQGPRSNASGATDESPTGNYSTAAQIVALERELDSATLLTGGPHDTSPRYNAVDLNDLPSSEAWNWTTYFDTLLAGSNDSIDDNVVISVSDALSIQDLWRVINSSLNYIVVNYVKFRVLVELSPFLGREGEDLLTLMHDLEAYGLKHRQAACFATLENLYKYGLGIASKLTASREYATVQRSYLDKQMRQQFKTAKRTLKALLAANRSWIGDAVKDATRKLNGMMFEFGARSDLVEYELYRDTRASTTSPNPNGTTSILTSVFRIRAHASFLYWNAYGSTSSPGFDNRFAASSLWAAHEYQRFRNSLFLPYAVVSLLNGVSNAIHPVFYPIVTPHVVRGVIRALTIEDTGNVDVHDGVDEQWRIGSEAQGRLRNVQDCLAHHYSTAPSADRVLNLTELDFLDNAMIYPLYMIYRAAIARSNAPRFFLKVPGGVCNEAQVFFYNLAAGMCDWANLTTYWGRQRKYGVTPARWRVNVPLRNFRFFAEAFRCAPDAYMNPTIECNLWKSPRTVSVTRL